MIKHTFALNISSAAIAKLKRNAKQSAKRRALCEIKASIRFLPDRPMSTSIREPRCIVGSYEDENGTCKPIDMAKVSPDLRHTRYGQVLAREISANWKDMPHIELANLRTFDEQRVVNMRLKSNHLMAEKAAERFIKTYGVLPGARRDGSQFTQNISEVEDLQAILRTGWELAASIPWIQADLPYEEKFYAADSDQIDDMQQKINEIGIELDGNYEQSKFDVIIVASGISLITSDLRIFISCLFMRDFRDEKLGVCKNPGCTTPYFVKRRKNQKYCETGPCTQYAHREAANKWWKENGERRRAKERGKNRQRTRKKR